MNPTPQQNPLVPATSEDPVLDCLNPIQREAVLHGDGPLLILAGAGSGKTRVLTRRVAHLILRRGVPPSRILAVTFTNKAAGEMRERVEVLLGYGIGGLWIGTFHSICLRLLRRHAERLGFRGEVTVFDQDDQTALLKQVLRESGNDDEAPRVRDLQSVISMAKNRMWDPDDLLSKWRHSDRNRFVSLYREYQSKLRAQDGVDFDDLLVLGVRLLETHSDLGDRYAEQFRYVLVDEYQDTNHVQYRLVRRLARGHGNVTVVGDDDQSIYGWRGADISNILDFERHFSDAKVLRMTQNYRSTQRILEVANAVVRRNEGRLEKALWTENAKGANVRLSVSLDEEAEARGIIEEIRARTRDSACRYGDVTILYRVHAQSRAFEEACLTLGVPYVIVGGIAFYQRREVKDLLAYLKLAVNPRDSVSFRRAVSAPKRGLGEVSLGRITGLADARDGDLAAACRTLGSEHGVRGRALEKAIEFGHLLEELRDARADGPEPLLRKVLDQTDYLTWLKETESATWEERQANVQELLEGAERYQVQIGEGSLDAYLDQVALYTNLDINAIEEDRVRMMTVHNAKGLEFSTVYITGLEEGLFPHSSALEDPAEMEEERRLFYVAATRAMETLRLSASLQRRRMNRFADGGLSRFIGEVPNELLEIDSAAGESVQDLMELAKSWQVRSPYGSAGYGPGSLPRRGGAPQPGPRWGNRAPKSAPPTVPLDLPAGGDEDGPVVQREADHASLKGTKVRHAVFGVGTVDDEDGLGPDARLLIFFPGAGKKKILARFVQPL